MNHSESQHFEGADLTPDNYTAAYVHNWQKDEAGTSQKGFVLSLPWYGAFLRSQGYIPMQDKLQITYDKRQADGSWMNITNPEGLQTKLYEFRRYMEVFIPADSPEEVQNIHMQQPTKNSLLVDMIVSKLGEEYRVLKTGLNSLDESDSPALRQ